MRASKPFGLTALLVSTSLNWGLLLNGFFIFLPELSNEINSNFFEVVTIAAWLAFMGAIWAVGKNFEVLIVNSGKLQFFVAQLLLVSAGVALSFSNLRIWSWPVAAISVAIAIGITSSAALSRAASGNQNLISGLIGATPLLGSFLIAVLYPLLQISAYFVSITLIFSAATSTFYKLTRLHSINFEKKSDPKINIRVLLWFGFLLSLAVASVNTYVYQRIDEVLGGDGQQVATTASTLIALAAAFGIVGSAITASQAMTKWNVVALARFASLLLSLGIVALLLATEIFMVAIAGSLIGLGFGLANGLELRMAMAATKESGSQLRMFTLLIVATTIPYVIAPALGFSLLGIGGGTAPILVAALLMAISSGFLFRRIA